MGNHDPHLPKGLGGVMLEALQMGALTFCHEPSVAVMGEVAGHLHPCVKLRAAARSIRRPCFAQNGQ